MGSFSWKETLSEENFRKKQKVVGEEVGGGWQVGVFLLGP